MIIAMDGPAGTGKGTISKLVSKRLGFLYIDTGAMYRAVTLKMIRENVALEDLQAIQTLVDQIQITFVQQDGEQHILLDGNDVSKEIRMPPVNELVSACSAIPIIRIKMVEMQRKLAEGNDVIMEGRDITTVVFPHADVKIYLTATLEERAKRRYLESCERGIATTYEETMVSIAKRDENDKKKEMGALKIAEDAVVIDSTNLSIEAVYEKVKKLIEEKRKS